MVYVKVINKLYDRTGKIIKCDLEDLATGQVLTTDIEPLKRAIKVGSITVMNDKLKDKDPSNIGKNTYGISESIIKETDTPKVNIPKSKTGSTSLAEWCYQNGDWGQQLLDEFNYEKNYPYTPENIAKSSNKKIWWICRICVELEIYLC